MGGIFSVYTSSIFWAWLIAHLFKYLIKSFQQKSFKFSKRTFDSGGMPSAHTATMSSLALVIGLTDGFSSSVFAVSFILLLIVMHDAVRVRRSTGEQGVAINKLIKEQKSNIKFPHFSEGHTPAEVAAGFILGLFIGLVVILAT
jgi:uncharacterized protein